MILNSGAHCGSFVSRADNWANKAIRRKTTGSGRCRYLKTMARKAKNGFREGAWETPFLYCRPLFVWRLDIVHPPEWNAVFHPRPGSALKLTLDGPLLSGTTAQKKQ